MRLRATEMNVQSLEEEAMKAAAKQVANMLQRPDQLEKVTALRPLVVISLLKRINIYLFYLRLISIRGESHGRRRQWRLC